MSFKLAHLLTQEAVLTEDQLELIFARRQKEGDGGLTLDSDICKAGHMSPLQANSFLAKTLDTPKLPTELLHLPSPSLTTHWTEESAQKYQLCPVQWDEATQTLSVVASLPFQPSRFSTISEETGVALRGFVISQIHFAQMMHHLYNADIPENLKPLTTQWPLSAKESAEVAPTETTAETTESTEASAEQATENSEGTEAPPTETTAPTEAADESSATEASESVEASDASSEEETAAESAQPTEASETPQESAPAEESEPSVTAEAPVETASTEENSAPSETAETTDAPAETVEATSSESTESTETTESSETTVAEASTEAADVEASEEAIETQTSDAEASPSEEAPVTAETTETAETEAGIEASEASAENAEESAPPEKELPPKPDKKTSIKAMTDFLGDADDVLDALFGGSMELTAYPPLKEKKPEPPPKVLSKSLLEEDEREEQEKARRAKGEFLTASLASLDAVSAPVASTDLDAMLQASFGDALSLGLDEPLGLPMTPATPKAPASRSVATEEISTPTEATAPATEETAQTEAAAPTEAEEPYVATASQDAAPARVADSTTPVPLSIRDAELLFSLACTRDSILELGLFFAAGVSDQAAVFMLPKDQAVGRYLHGTEGLQSVFRTFAIPINGDTIFQKIRNSIVPYSGPIPKTKADRIFFALFDPPPLAVYFFPVRLRGRNIATLYCHQYHVQLGSKAYEHLIRCSHLAAEALERVVISLKQGVQEDDPAIVNEIFACLRANDHAGYEALVSPLRPEEPEAAAEEEEDEEEDFVFEEPVMLVTVHEEEAPQPEAPAPEEPSSEEPPAPQEEPSASLASVPPTTPQEEPQATESAEAPPETPVVAETTPVVHTQDYASSEEAPETPPAPSSEGQSEAPSATPEESSQPEETNQGQTLAMSAFSLSPQEAPTPTIATNEPGAPLVTAEFGSQEAPAEPSTPAPDTDSTPAASQTPDTPTSPYTEEVDPLEETIDATALKLQEPKEIEFELVPLTSKELSLIGPPNAAPSLTTGHLSTIRTPDGFMIGSDVVSAYTRKDGATISSSPTLRDSHFLAALGSNGEVKLRGTALAESTAQLIQQTVSELFADLLEPAQKPGPPPPPPKAGQTPSEEPTQDAIEATAETAEESAPSTEKEIFGAELFQPSKLSKHIAFQAIPDIDFALPELSPGLSQLIERFMDEAQHDAALKELLQRPPHEMLAALLHAFPGRVEPRHVQPDGTLSFEWMEDPSGRLWNLLLDYPQETTVGLQAILQRADTKSRLLALLLLRQLHWEPLLPLLFRLLLEADVDIAMHIRKLFSMDRQSVALSDLLEWVRAHLNDENPEQTLQAISILREVRDGNAIPDLVELLDSKVKPVCAAAHSALVAISCQPLPDSARKWRKWWNKTGSNTERLDWLIEGIQQKDTAIIEASIRDLREVTGLEFGYDPNAPKKQKQAAIQQWKAWYKHHS